MGQHLHRAWVSAQVITASDSLRYTVALNRAEMRARAAIRRGNPHGLAAEAAAARYSVSVADVMERLEPRTITVNGVEGERWPYLTTKDPNGEQE